MSLIEEMCRLQMMQGLGAQCPQGLYAQHPQGYGPSGIFAQYDTGIVKSLEYDNALLRFQLENAQRDLRRAREPKGLAGFLFGGSL